MKFQQFLWQTLLLCMLLLTTATTLSASNSAGSKPQWVSKGEEILNAQRTNDTYYFKIIRTFGADLTQAKNARMAELANYIGKRNKIEGEAVTDMGKTHTNGTQEEHEIYSVTFKNQFSTEVFQSQLVDEWWEYVTQPGGRGEYQYYALFAVSERGDGKADFDHIEVSRTYGPTPIFMSIFPGAGQLYKGNTFKGWCMLGGAVVGIGTIIFCENERASYATKIKEQPKHAQTYKTKADNYETARNVAIGVTGALVVWSVIDAAVAPGATRIKVRPGEQLRIQPAAFVTPHTTAFGATLCYSF